MAAATQNEAVHANATVNGQDHHHGTHHRKGYDYGGNPLAHIGTNNSGPPMLTAFGGEFQPGLYKPIKDRKIANPAPLGLCGFALTTFLLSLINLQTRDIAAPSLVIGPAFAYGGLCQLLAGMWDMAVGNTFGATALSSYGGFWIAVGIILTPGGFEVVDTLSAADGGVANFYDSFGLFLMGFFIFTFLLVLCTLRSTVAFFFLFFTLDLAFLMLGIGYLQRVDGKPSVPLLKAGGVFGLLAAFAAWYNAFAGIADSSNSFFVIPVAHFPWSDKGRESREKVDNSEARAAQEGV